MTKAVFIGEEDSGDASGDSGESEGRESMRGSERRETGHWTRHKQGVDLLRDALLQMWVEIGWPITTAEQSSGVTQNINK